jgi:predicted enzyme related to lactoylglutathione lyase
MSDTEGTFAWYELQTTDVEGAIAFYSDVIGWEAEAAAGAMPYWMWRAGSRPLGGLMRVPDEAKAAGARAHWLGYVATADVDASTRKAVSLGANACVPPTDIPDVGRFSVVVDHQGAALALFKGLGAASPQPTEPTARHFVWHELLADDWEAELRFYGQLFGWQKTDAVPMGDFTYQIYGKGGRSFGGMMNRPAGYPLRPHWLYYVRVDDLDDALERVKLNGGSVWSGPMAIPDGQRIAQCADPQGATFALHGT